MTPPDLSDPSAWDIVDQASYESFPASDPPAWGSSHAAPSESTVAAPELVAPTAPRRRARVALGVLAAGLAISVLFVLGRKRRHRSH